MNLLIDEVTLNSEEAKEFRERENQNKLFALKVFSVIGGLISTFYTLSYLLRGNVYVSSISALIVFVCGLVFLMSFSKFKYEIPAFTLTLSVAILMLVLFITGGPTGYDMLWYYMFPALTLFVVGLVIGSIMTIGLLIVSIVLSFSYNIPVVTGYYTIDFKVLFFLSYIGVFALSFTYEYIRAKTRKQLFKSMFQLIKNEQAMNAKSEFMVELSHQIRTPLSSIMGITTIMKNEATTKDQKDYIDAINTSVMNVSMVLNNLKNISEIKADSDFDNILNFNIRDVVKRGIVEFQKNTGKTIARSSFNVSDYIPSKLTGNTKKIEQLLHVIFNTIIDHSRKNEASFDVYVNDKKETVNAIEVLFEIHSSTLKTETDDIEEKIDYSSDESNGENTEGTVLSSQTALFDMEEAKRIVESFGGTIGFKKIDSSINVFWFTILLWKTRTLENAPADHIKKMTQTHKGKTLLSEASILIVEDNLMNQKVLTLSLKPKVKKIEIAQNGKEALKLLEHLKFDAILMDVQMPILDGYKTTAKIKELELGTDIHTPIIALTASAMQGDKEKCLAYGMDDYISKPFQLDTLLEKLEYHLARRKI
mgnify:CR=1 FL=1